MSLLASVKLDRTLTIEGDEKLMTLLVRVFTSILIRRNVESVENSLRIEWRKLLEVDDSDGASKVSNILN
jgi:hypothetical protein